MLGAYAMVVLFSGLGVPYWVAFVARGRAHGRVRRGVRGRDLLAAALSAAQLPVIISTIGASILLSNLGARALRAEPGRCCRGCSTTPGSRSAACSWTASISPSSSFTALLVVLQYVVFERTMLGKKLQATSQDKEMASLLGIPVAAMVLITFAYSAALGGFAGVLVAPVLFVSVGMGALIALKAFAANIIGGFGSIPGAILGGLALGIVETFGAAYISVPYKDAIAFAVLLLFLLVRPQGLFGERIAEKAVSAAASRRCRVAAAVARAALALAVAGAAVACSRRARATCSTSSCRRRPTPIGVLGLVVVLGYCGQISLAQAAFFGLGAYGVALRTTRCRAAVLSRRCCSAWSSRRCSALLLGLASLRLGGHYLAMVTISFQQILTAGADQLDRPHARAGRRVGHPAPGAGSTSGARASSASAWSCSCCAPGRPGGSSASRLGRAMQAVRDNEIAAGTCGIDVFRTKVVAFAHQRLAGRARRRAVRGRVRLYQPGPVHLRREHRDADDGAARRRAVAVRRAARHAAAGDPAGVAALPARRSISRSMARPSSSSWCSCRRASGASSPTACAAAAPSRRARSRRCRCSGAGRRRRRRRSCSRCEALAKHFGGLQGARRRGPGGAARHACTR